MPASTGENDSIITFGLELAEATEQSVGEIASGVAQEFAPAAGSTVEPKQATQEAGDAEQAIRPEELARWAAEEQAQKQAQALEYNELTL